MDKTEDIEKAMGMPHQTLPVGTVHNGYKKVAEGKWVKVAKGRAKGKGKPEPKGRSKKPQESKAKKHGKAAATKKTASAKKEESKNALSDHEKDYFINNKKEILPHVHSGNKEELRNAVRSAIKQHKAGTLNEEKKGRPSVYKNAGERLVAAEKALVRETKKWADIQRNFYQHGKAQAAGSPERKSLAKMVRAKAEGVVKALKNEGVEVMETGKLFGKLFSGHAGDVTKAEKHALKNTSIHIGMVVAASMMGGEAGGIASAGLGEFMSNFAVHWVEHVAALSTGHALFFAKGMDHYLQAQHLSGENAFHQVIEGIADHIENGNIPSDVWDKASNGDK